MNPAEYERMYALEDWYWWFVARRTAAAAFLRDHLPSQRPLHVLDAGCGTGALLDLLATWPDTAATGLDCSHLALLRCLQRGHSRLAAGDLTRIPFRDECFDAVTALDVLEHVEDDAAAAAELWRVLRPGGVLVASVPAYQLLWGPHDEALHHFRRYEARGISTLLGRAGFRVEYLTFLLCGLFPAAALHRLVQRGLRTLPHPGGSRVRNGALVPVVPRALNRALIAFHGCELAVARRWRLPWGLSLLAVGRKPAPERVCLRLPEEGVPATVARW